MILSRSFGGGCAVITETGIDFYNTTSMIDRAISREIGDRDKAADGHVLAVRDAGHVLSF